MAVYKRTYKAYRGPLTPAWSRFTVLSNYGFSTLFESRPFTAFAMLCLVPFLIGVVFIYLIHSATVQALLGVRMGPALQVNRYWFMNFMAIEAWMGFLLTAWVGPGMITRDFANHSVQLYLSRPLSRPEYLLGKASVLGVLLSLTSWIPALVLFGLQAALEGGDWGWQNLWLVGSITIAGLIYIVFLVLLTMAVSVWVRWRIAATGLMLGVFFLLPGLGNAAKLILRTKWGELINFPRLIVEIWLDLFRYHRAPFETSPLFSSVPTWAAWTSVLTACSICVLLLNSRLRAREVERA